MSLPSFVAAGTVQNGLAAITPGIPAGIQNNDILLLLVQTQGAQPATAPSGWTDASISNTAGTTAGLSLAVFWKRTTGTESAPTVADSGDHQIAIIYAFRNCRSTATPINGFSTTSVTAASTTYTAPTVTSTYADCLGLAFMGNAIDSNTNSSPQTATNSAGRTPTLIDSQNSNTGSGGGWSTFTFPVTAVGASGTTSGTGTSSVQVNITVLLQPEISRTFVTT